VNGRLLYCHPPPSVSDPSIFDIHALALAQFPDLAEPDTPETAADEADAEASPAAEPTAEEIDFDTTVEDKRVQSKRLKKHGRKGRKGRDKNPYEDSDLPGGVAGVHINSGGKKKNRRP
jgi:large subunit GTPase 1